MIILIASQKGGCGKSTLATNISVVLAHLKYDVLLVDSDKQHSATNWALERSDSHPTLPRVNWVQQHENISTMLKDLDSRYEVLIIDAAGKDSIEMRSAMIVADVLIIPCRPAQFDLDTLPRMVSIVVEARIINPNLLAHCVITMSPGQSKSDTNESIKFIRGFRDINLLSTIIGDRKIFRDSSSTGMGVTELPAKTVSDKAGNDELIDLVKELGLWR